MKISEKQELKRLKEQQLDTSKQFSTKNYVRMKYLEGKLHNYD